MLLLTMSSPNRRRMLRPGLLLAVHLLTTVVEIGVAERANCHSVHRVVERSTLGNKRKTDRGYRTDAGWDSRQRSTLGKKDKPMSSSRGKQTYWYRDDRMERTDASRDSRQRSTIKTMQPWSSKEAQTDRNLLVMQRERRNERKGCGGGGNGWDW